MTAELSPIRVELTHYRCFREESPSTISLPVGGVVALTGVNNSGKSTALRFFYELKIVHEYLLAVDNDWSAVVNHTIRSNWKFQRQQTYGISDSLELFPDRSSVRPLRFKLNSRSIEFECEVNIAQHSPPRDQLQVVKTANRKVLDPNRDFATTVLQELSEPLSRILYIGPFRNIVNDAGGGGTYYDLWNGSAFVNQWNDLKNGADTVSAENAAKVQSVIQELLAFQSLQIDASSDRKSLLVNVDGRRFNLSELGAGISQLIMCLINVAVKRPSWILIDEPELHLHPSMQSKFVEALARFATHGVVIATHSIGLARTVADEVLVVVQARKDHAVITPLKSVKNYAQLLGELSFSQYEALGFDKILLVEGVTDVRTFHQLLPKFGAKKVLVVPLGGNAMIDPDRQMELEEFKRFNVEVFVLIDSERDSVENTLAKREAFIKVCETLFGVGHAMQTNFRATENYLPEKAIRLAMRSEKYVALTPFQSFDSLSPRWGKNDNWKIAAESTKQDWIDTDIGQFLSKLA